MQYCLQFETRVMMKIAALRAGKEKIEPSWVRLVRSQVESMHFGVVQIVVHDSRVVQIERTEKLRLDRLETQAHFPDASEKGHLQKQVIPPSERASIMDAPGENFPADQATGDNLTQ
ncbi:MAG: YezD family protein [Verrucomicrobia bacterium]|nr:YezD family protein [Verrucomicrobiota bacterium]